MYADREKGKTLDYFYSTLGGLLACLGLPGLLSPLLTIPGVWMLLRSVEERGRGVAAKRGFLWGVVYFGAMVWWIAPTISHYGQLPLWAAIPIVALLVLYLAFYPAVWAYTYALLPVETGITRAAWGAALWGVSEWLRGKILTGFPWGVLALGLSAHPFFIQPADLLGIYGVGVLFFLSVASGFSMVSCYQKGDKRGALWSLLGLLVITLLWTIYGMERERRFSLGNEATIALDAAGGPVCAISVQGSIPQRLKWDPELKEETLRRYLDLTRKGLSKCSDQQVKMAVWPETAVTTYLQEDMDTLFRLSSFARANGLYLLFGAPSYEVRDGGGSGFRFYNSAYLIGPDGTLAARYDKRHLVPFGEYMPLGPFSDLARSWLPTAGDFVSGDRGGVLDSHRGLKIGTLICFESIFPELARDSVLQGANLLAVITNDAWFGRTPAPFQHEAMSVFRAVEERRWLIRAANTGVSSIIAPTGERVVTTDIFVPAVISHTIRPMKYWTPYSRIGESGFWTLILLLLAMGVGRFLFKRY